MIDTPNVPLGVRSRVIRPTSSSLFIVVVVAIVVVVVVVVVGSSSSRRYFLPRRISLNPIEGGEESLHEVPAQEAKLCSVANRGGRPRDVHLERTTCTQGSEVRDPQRHINKGQLCV
ncbi:hypothetical protein KM043_012757 [Ampulex compressa]|nr:hypothetical protein KM043_012757 [Ampulex compressa]